MTQRSGRALPFEIAAALAAKAAALALIYLAFFSSAPKLPDAPARLFSVGEAP